MAGVERQAVDAAGAVLLEARGLDKRFGATHALRSVDLSLTSGAVHALVGENGAGKSTLIKILSGVYAPDAGAIVLDGRAYAPTTPAEANAAGLALIPQELRVAPAMSVADNVLLGHWPTTGVGPLAGVSGRRLHERARLLLDSLGVSVDTRRPVGTLSFAERQLIVIARALGLSARCLILDEPTASLESREAERLFEILDRLRADGVGILYVSHRLDEITRLADRVTVLRDGHAVARYRRGGFSTDDLIRDMTGRSLAVLRRAHQGNQGAPVFEATLPGPNKQVVSLHERCVTGLAGLLGSGTSAALLSLFGACGARRSEVAGAPVRIRSPEAAIRAGIGYVPGERALGIVPALTVWENITLPHVDRFRKERVSWSRMRALAATLADRLDIRPRDVTLAAGTLSGGNQQKVLFARWLMGRIRVLLLDEPTHGIDIGAKATIDLLIREFAEDGGAVMMTSSEFHELLNISDEVLTMRAGRFTAHIRRGEPDYGEKTLRDELGG